MADQQQSVPGGHYSGSNKVPTINKFLENLDRDKKNRDKEIDEQKNIASQQKNGDTGIVPHQNAPKAKKGQKTVTDPVTGKEVVIEDANKDMLKQVENPIVFAHQPTYPESCRLTNLAHRAKCQSWKRYGKIGYYLHQQLSY
jgi:hypothetical protein